MFSSPKNVDIKHLEDMKYRYVVLHFITITLLLYLPVMYRIALYTPYELYRRLNIDSTSNLIKNYFNEKGLDYLQILSSGEISKYIDDINNILVQTGIYQQILNFALIGSLSLIIIINFTYIFIITIAYNYSRNLYSTIKFKNLFKINVFSSTFPAVVAVITSTFIGVLHLFIFQVIQCFWILLFLKSYDKKEKELVANL